MILFRLSLWRPATTLRARLTIVVALALSEVFSTPCQPREIMTSSIRARLTIVVVLALSEVFSTPCQPREIMTSSKTPDSGSFIAGSKYPPGYFAPLVIVS